MCSLYLLSLTHEIAQGESEICVKGKIGQKCQTCTKPVGIWFWKQRKFMNMIIYLGEEIIIYFFYP